MRLTPIQMRKQEFARKFRGFDPEEVDAFLSTAANDFEEEELLPVEFCA